MKRNEKDQIKLNRVLRNMIIESSEQELREAMEETGEDFDSLVAQGRALVKKALNNTESSNAVMELHKGLGTLVKMLRRQAHLSVEELASKANIDSDELRQIEMNPTFEANPRTIFQLENYFKLPKKSLVVLSGAVVVENGVYEEAMRFAANAENITELSKEEKKLLNEFVKFLESTQRDEK